MNKKILFVIDMQNDFIDGSLGSEDAKKIVPNVVNLIEIFHGDIWFTQDTHFYKPKNPYRISYENTLEGKFLPIQHCIDKSKGWELNSEIVKAASKYDHPKVRYFMKYTFGSIDMVKEASLYLWENPKSNDELFIVGLCSDICVISNALLLRAQFPNLKITCYEDCCAGTSKEAHDAAMLMMKSNQINIERFIN